MHELARIRARRRRGDDAGHNVRALASLVRTLASLEDLRARRGDPRGMVPGGQPQRPSRSLEELRDALVRQVQSIRAERDRDKDGSADHPPA